MNNEIVTKINSNIERVTPLPEPEWPGVKRIQPWDKVVIDKCIQVATSWAKVNHPVTDTFEHFWPLVKNELRRDRMFKLYVEVRSLLPDLPVVALRYGDSPGAPGRLEAFYDRHDDEDYRSVCFADPFDEELYISHDGGNVLAQVWFTDDGGTLDIIELDNIDPERVAAAFRFMWNKHLPFYRNTEGGV
jgi:hypothetical protein